ncbi:unnamed protein product [Somion occarium]|uniref:BAR-domain-containing protein n=1 Tax=Somion occarium TaxID=3059160 RepID=A0ABP1CSP8_9APHY
MASKQLGKLRQWAGEVISSRDKTAISDEFKELERDIDLRRQGLSKLHVTSEDYKHALSKKRDSEALPQEGKLLPIDALGIVMMQHGEEFGDESAFVNLGKAHCKIATLQETFTISFEDSFIDSIQRYEDEIKEYQHQRKKLDSRRLSLDAAYSKLEKLKSNKAVANSKKDRELKDAEEEYEEAKSRYEETLSDVRLRMSVIQENEIDQLRSLTDLLHLEMTFIKQYTDVLKEVKDGWVDETTMSELEQQHRLHQKPPAPASISRSSSTKLHHSRSFASEPASDEDGEDAEQEKEKSGGFRARAKSFTRRKSDAGSRAPSRPQSRAERKRSDSSATAASKGDVDDSELEKSEKEKEKEKKAEKSKRLTVAGWASSKVSSISSIGRSKKEKEKFSALMEDQDDVSDEDNARRAGSDDDEDGGTVRRTTSVPLPSVMPPKPVKSKSSPSTPTPSPKISTRLVQRSSSTQASPVSSSPRITSSLQALHSVKPKPRVVVAMYDFTASSPDELSFKAGDQIIVTNEVVDGWWMGELKNGSGKKGLFPSSYTRPLPEKDSSSSSLSLPTTANLQPAFSRRPEPLTNLDHADSPHSDDESALGVSATIPMAVNSGTRFGFGFEDPSVSDLEEDDHHPFSDQFIASSRSPLHQHRYNIGQERSDADSFTTGSSDLDSYDDERNNLVATPSAQDIMKDRIVHAAPPVPPRRPVDITPKKAPPPPPPRRNLSNAPSASSTPPPIPALPHRPGTLHSHSSLSLSSGASSFINLVHTTAPGNDVGADGLTYSPFDSPRDGTFAGSRSGGCSNFKQNPFKPKGMCNNCFQMHT